MKKSYPVMDADGHLASNEIWNIPSESEVRGVLKTAGSCPVSYRALAMDMHKRVFGLRTMYRVRESGHDLEGRVKIEGMAYRAFTSSEMFAREDGSLCNVAIVYVCGTPEVQYPDPERLTGDERAQLLNLWSRRYHYEGEGIYRDLCEYARQLQAVEDGSADKYPWCEYREHTTELRARLLAPMGW